MTSRVAPNEVSVPGNNEEPSLILVQPTKNDARVGNLTLDRGNNAEQLLKTIDEIYSPVLKLMALFGTYFRDTSLKHLPGASGRKQKKTYLYQIYCVVVASGLWLNFIISLTDVFLGENIYVYTLFSLWSLLIALSATICLIVLCVPLGDSKKTTFENFLRKLLAINSSVDLEKVKSKAKKGVIVFCFLFILGAIGVIITYEVMDITISGVKPWKEWLGFRILSLIFFTYGMGEWFLPILFFYITCLILEALFDDLHKRMSSFQPFLVDIGTFKKEHCRLREVVEFADKMLAPLLFGLVSLYIPFICFEFYKAVNPPKDHELVYLIGNIFWLASAAGILTVIMAFGSKVSEKIHSFQKILQTFPVSKEDERMVLTAIQALLIIFPIFILIDYFNQEIKKFENFKIVSFMQDLQGEPKGLSVGGLAVITKATSLTIIGAIVSYVAVIWSLPK